MNVSLVVKVVALTIALVVAFFLAVSFLGWRENDLLGKTPREVHELIGQPMCRHMDLETWFWGITTERLQILGIAMDVYYGEDRKTGTAIVVRVRRFPDILGLLNGCAYWEDS